MLPLEFSESGVTVVAFSSCRIQAVVVCKKRSPGWAVQLPQGVSIGATGCWGGIKSIALEPRRVIIERTK